MRAAPPPVRPNNAASDSPDRRSGISCWHLAPRNLAPTQQARVQGREQLIGGCRAEFSSLKTLDQCKRDIKAEIVRAHRVLCLGVVLVQEGLKARPIRVFIVVAECKTEQVGRETSEIQSRIRAPARLEAIKIEAAVHAIVHAIPTKRAVNGSQDSRLLARGPVLDSLS